MTLPFDIWDQDATREQHANIAEVIGLTVTKAWLMPGKRSLLFSLDPDWMVMIEPMETVGMKALQVTVGHVKPGADFHQMDRMCPWDPHLYGLEGQTFGGLDCDIAMFGPFGVLIQSGKPVEWKKQA